MTKTILLVDDAKSNTMRLQKNLKDCKYEIIFRSSINRATTYINTHIPTDEPCEGAKKGKCDLVIIDLYIPNDYSQLESYANKFPFGPYNQGRLLAEFLKRHYPCIPFIFVSNNPDFFGEDKKESDHVFSKKVSDIDKIIEHIQKELE